MNKSNASLFQLLLDKLDSIDETTLSKKKVFNVKDLSTYTGWSKAQIYKMSSANLIPFSKPTNGSLFFSREKIEEWLLSNPIGTPNSSLENVQDYLNRKAG